MKKLFGYPLIGKTLVNNVVILLIGVAIGGVAIGGLVYGLLKSYPATDMAEQGDDKPLYWVAPMDPNYRSDQAGKSPMGMDLVPVFEENSEDNGAGASSNGPGTVRISPDVINNLGVRTARAQLQALHTQIRTVGYVQYDEDRLVHIHPRISGWIEVLHVKAEGNPVTKGQKLYEIYSPELVNAQEEMLLALQRNNQPLVRASEDRLKALQIPDTTIAQLKKSRQVQQTITINAPQSGVLDNLHVREGFYVQPGTTMMSIGALDEVWVQAEIFERQAALVKVNAPVTMSLDYLPGKTWEGKVDYVYPTLDATTRTVKVRMRFANPEAELKPNMFAQVAIHSDDDTPSLLIPKEALIRTGSSQRVVLALGEGKFKSVAVNAGRQDDVRVEILSGLLAGDEVVVSAQFLLDSESSISSDFKRMSHDDGDETMSRQLTDSVWAEGTITSIMSEHRMLTVTHAPIPEWDWPTMTMDFKVADDIDFAPLATDMAVRLQIHISGNNQYTITAIQTATDSTVTAQDSTPESPSAPSPDHNH